MAGTAKQSAVPFRVAEQLPGLFSIIRPMAGSCTAGWFLEPRVPAIFNRLSHLKNAPVAILAFGYSACCLVHHVPPTLGIGTGMALVAISGGPGFDELAMFFVNDL